MSDDPGTCHLPNCDAPRVSMTLCQWHAAKLLKPITHPRPVEPVKRRWAA